MEEVLTEEEVFAALLDLTGDKAPRLDGFSIAFWKFSLDLLR